MPAQKNWKISEKTHRRVRILCAPDDISQEKLANLALDAYEISLVTGTEGLSTAGTGENRLFLRMAEYTRALAKIGSIVREVFSEEGKSAGNAESHSGEIEADIPSVEETLDLLEEDEDGAEKPPRRTPKKRGGKR